MAQPKENNYYSNFVNKQPKGLVSGSRNEINKPVTLFCQYQLSHIVHLFTYKIFVLISPGFTYKIYYNTNSINKKSFAHCTPVTTVRILCRRFRQIYTKHNHKRSDDNKHLYDLYKYLSRAALLQKSIHPSIYQH